MLFDYPFLNIMHELMKKGFKPVLVGGWVPTVYFEFLWHSENFNVPTKDIDFAFSPTKKSQHTVESSINQDLFTHRHLHLGKLKPYQLIYKNGNIPVDFLADEKTAETVHTHVLGKGI